MRLKKGRTKKEEKQKKIKQREIRKEEKELKDEKMKMDGYNSEGCEGEHSSRIEEKKTQTMFEISESQQGGEERVISLSTVAILMFDIMDGV